METKKLIIIRGNSASGKSAVAEQLRIELGGKVAVVGLDTLRRTILREPDELGNIDIIGLLDQTVRYSLEHGYTVIVEGILSKPKYRDLLMEMMNIPGCDSAVFYIDVSIEETIKRHKTKPIADEVTDEQLRSWYQPKNYLDVPDEVIIGDASSLEDTVRSIREAITI